jgi:DNA-binding transcriptional LysR family regulator
LADPAGTSRPGRTPRPTRTPGQDRTPKPDRTPGSAGTAGPTGAGPASPDLAAYADCRWIAGCERCRSYLIRQCEAAGFTPKIAFTTDDYVAVQALVAAGLGVTTLPGLCLRAARHPGLSTVPLPGARRHVFAMTYGQPPDPATTVKLIDVLAKVATPDI